MQAINLQPALALLGLAVALAVLSTTWVAWRSKRKGVSGWLAWQHVYTVLALWLTLDLLVFGAFTRLTDSGLGCPDWPGCYGELHPWAADAHIQQAYAQQPTGPVAPHKAWIEMVHRYLATMVGALITGLMVSAWWQRWLGQSALRGRVLSPWWATGTWLWVCGQGAFGALTVALKLQPLVVTLHLLGALLGVGLLVAQVAWQRQALARRASRASAGASIRKRWQALRSTGRRPCPRGPIACVLVLVVVQVVLGAWVSSNYAVLACSGWPLCQGQWWPDTDWALAFDVWRPWRTHEAGWLTLQALTTIHLAHRWMAVPVLLALLSLGWWLRSWQAMLPGGPWPRHPAQAVWGLAAWQVLSGLSNVLLGWPLLSALAHTLGAALLVAYLVHLLVEPAWRGSTIGQEGRRVHRPPRVGEPRQPPGARWPQAGVVRASLKGHLNH